MSSLHFNIHIIIMIHNQAHMHITEIVSRILLNVAIGSHWDGFPRIGCGAKRISLYANAVLC